MRYNPGLHRIALLTAAATFPLIFMGGLVTSNQAGMSVPDWPNTYGYNMFLFPPSQWVGGIFYEHAHRLKGTVVGFLSIMLVLHAWGPAADALRRRRLGTATLAAGMLGIASAVAVLGLLRAGIITGETSKMLSHLVVGIVSLALVLLVAWLSRRPEPRRAVRWLAVTVLAAVIFQGILGGLRVELISLNLAVFHACMAQAFFCLAAVMCVVTSRWWIASGAQAFPSAGTPGEGLLRLAVVALALIYLQLIAGALMRHHEAGLAIPDLPLAYGGLLPPISADGLQVVNQQRAWEMQMKPVTLGQIWMHFAHRLGAIFVSVALVWLAVRIFRRHREHSHLTWPAAMLMGLLVIQIVLGVLTVLLGKPADIATAHVAAGALVLVTTFVLTVRAFRLYGCVNELSHRDHRESITEEPAHALSVVKSAVRI